MRETIFIIANYGLFVLATTALATLQVTFWFQSFGFFPPAHFWLPVLVFWGLHREPWEGLLMTYLISFVISGVTALPLGLLLGLNIVIFAGTIILKSRIYWTGPTYFMMVSGLAAGALPIVHLILSWFFEINPIIDFQLFDWVMRSLWTALMALPLYHAFLWLDKLTHKEPPTEAGTEIL